MPEQTEGHVEVAATPREVVAALAGFEADPERVALLGQVGSG